MHQDATRAQLTSGIEAFLGTVRLWIANATDAEVRTVFALVEAELERRGPGAEGTPTEAGT